MRLVIPVQKRIRQVSRSVQLLRMDISLGTNPLRILQLDKGKNLITQQVAESAVRLIFLTKALRTNPYRS